MDGNGENPNFVPFELILRVGKSDGPVDLAIYKLLQITLQKMAGGATNNTSPSAHFSNTSQYIGIFSTPRVCECEDVLEEFALLHVRRTIERVLIFLKIESLGLVLIKKNFE